MSPAETTHQSQSTGPRTPEGKAISAMNAMRHGLTGRVVVLPSEDMNIYRAFCKELMEELAPATPMERQYAQTFCDTQWRLNRARSYEDSMLALGHFEHADSLGVQDPQTLAALTAAKVFRDNSKAFVNLSLYEQRLARQQKEALRQLEELQTKRRAARPATEHATEQAAKQAESVDRNPNKMTASATQEFVYSTAEINREDTRANLNEDPRPEAKNAQYSQSSLPEAA
jgi:hypothetical protein